ncbi:hypothetical protein V1478_005461 [Vespula squamosa]|uniref:Uncharacterized protein n=1 Tax=Vespula squamosa TaxID=30214 RepID=A0ABD2BE78_VESSQ
MLDDVQRRSSYSTPQAIWVSQNTTSGWSLPVKQGGSNETIGRGTTFAGTDVSTRENIGTKTKKKERKRVSEEIVQREEQLESGQISRRTIRSIESESHKCP